MGRQGGTWGRNNVHRPAVWGLYRVIGDARAERARSLEIFFHFRNFPAGNRPGNAGVRHPRDTGRGGHPPITKDLLYYDMKIFWWTIIPAVNIAAGPTLDL